MWNGSSKYGNSNSSKDYQKDKDKDDKIPGSTPYNGKVDYGRYGAVGDGRSKKYK